MTSPEPKRLPAHVLIRDLLILQLKLALDGFKDVFLSPLAVGAAVLDVLAGPPAEGYRLYKVLYWGEKFDLWLNLYGATGEAESSGEGLYGGSRAGDSTLIGRLERLVKGYEEPEEPEPSDEPDTSGDGPRRD